MIKHPESRFKYTLYFPIKEINLRCWSGISINDCSGFLCCKTVKLH